jgi:hypothetical protein
MNLNTQHKAIFITLSISIILLCFLLNVVIVTYKPIQVNSFKEETLVEILAEDIKASEEKMQYSKASTNQAFNENGKHIAQVYEVIEPAKDFDIEDFTSKTDPDLGVEISDNKDVLKKDITKVNSIKDKRFNKAHTILEQQKANLKKGSHKNSSVSYSLVQREAYALPIPVYLCDGGGKIVIKITVSKQGRVKTTSVNKRLSSSNACLQDYALQYAKKASFSLGQTDAQIGTITYMFQ